MTKAIVRCLAALIVIATPWFVWANSSSDREAVEKAAQRWWAAFTVHDIDELLQQTASDASVIDSSRVLASGHSDIRALLGSAPRVKVTSQTKDLVVAGDVAWRTAAISQAELTEVSYVLEIWKRVGSGWQLHRHASSGVLTSPLRPRRIPSHPVLDRMPGTPTG